MERFDPIPAWAVIIFTVLIFSLGFEAGRAFTFLHHLYDHLIRRVRNAKR